MLLSRECLFACSELGCGWMAVGDLGSSYILRGRGNARLIRSCVTSAGRWSIRSRFWSAPVCVIVWSRVQISLPAARELQVGCRWPIQHVVSEAWLHAAVAVLLRRMLALDA